MRAAAAYERGLKPVTHLIDVADEQTAMRLRAAATCRKGSSGCRQSG